MDTVRGWQSSLDIPYLCPKAVNMEYMHLNTLSLTHTHIHSQFPVYLAFSVTHILRTNYYSLVQKWVIILITEVLITKALSFTGFFFLFSCTAFYLTFTLRFFKKPLTPTLQMWELQHSTFNDLPKIACLLHLQSQQHEALLAICLHFPLTFR